MWTRHQRQSLFCLSPFSDFRQTYAVSQPYLTLAMVPSSMNASPQLLQNGVAKSCLLFVLLTSFLLQGVRSSSEVADGMTSSDGRVRRSTSLQTPLGKRITSTLVEQLGKRPKELYSFGIGEYSTTANMWGSKISTDPIQFCMIALSLCWTLFAPHLSHDAGLFPRYWLMRGVKKN